MKEIRIVQGTASGPTAMASYDAALAEAGIENYNLVSVSSVIPAEATVTHVGTAPDLGPIGEQLTVVEARATAKEPSDVSAALAWSQSIDEGPGLFYEAAGNMDRNTVEQEVTNGLLAGQKLREWEFEEPELAVANTHAVSGKYTTALVLAVYGQSEPLI